MVRRGPHPVKALSAVRVRGNLAAGRYGDGNGLYLVVDPSGARRWIVRIVVHGRRRDIGLGSAGLVSLAEARDLAIDYRRMARSGGDPLAVRRRATSAIPTFAEASERTHAEHKAAWKNAKHADQWLNTLRDYAWPVIGAARVDQIESPDVLRVLGPIWLTKPETARRVRQRIGSVLDWAKAAGFRDGENPVRGVIKGLPRQPARKQHHAAMDYRDVPGFVESLKAGKTAGGIAALALEFLILTAGRTNEVIGARWDEIDFERRVWTIPASRMKSKVEHRVPLSPRALEIHATIRKTSPAGPFIFAGTRQDSHLSNMALLMLMRRMGQTSTVHGFRSCFRDWASEQTGFPSDVCEMALAHTIRNKAEAAYRRGDLFAKRQALMSAWANYVGKPESTQVVAFAARSRS